MSFIDQKQKICVPQHLMKEVFELNLNTEKENMKKTKIFHNLGEYWAKKS